MRTLASPIAVLVAVLSASTAPAAPYADRVTEGTLDNGLKVIVLEDHKAPVAVLQVWYRVGSRNERLGRTGLSHLLEHMMFKGTKTVGPDEYSRIIQRQGGNENAFTTQDATVYFATLASDRLQVALDLEADRMANLVLDERLFEPERAVVAEERRLRTEDNPTGALFELLSAAAYTAHPYQWPVIGWMNDIQKSTRDDLHDYYRRHYHPRNAFVVVVGDVDPGDVLGRIERAFGHLANPPTPPPEVRSVEPPQRGERRVSLRKEAELPMVALAHHVPTTPHADAPALTVLAEILAGGKSARLHDTLVYKRRLATSVGASFDDKSKDPSVFVVYGQPLPGVSAATLEAALLEEMARIQAEEPSPREFEKVKNAVEAGYIFAQDSSFYQGMLLGQYEILGDWRLIDRQVSDIGAVTGADVKRVAMTYLTAENRTVATLDPLPPSVARRAAPPAGGPIDH